jgi:GNAT superfamily N-acetyltransferase
MMTGSARHPMPVHAANDDAPARLGRRIEIVEVRSPEQVAAFADLVRSFVAWCRVRYSDRAWMVDAYFTPSALEAELADLEAKYAPPGGVMLLALVDGRACGSIAFRALDRQVCEMKRLFVTGTTRGLGRRLTTALLELARARGFTAMRLETGDMQPEAMSLYRSLGFREIAPYYDAPADLKPHLTFMERWL